MLLFGGAGYCALKGYQRVTAWDDALGNVTGLRIEGPGRMFATVQFSAANGRVYRFEEPSAWDTRARETRAGDSGGGDIRGGSTGTGDVTG